MFWRYLGADEKLLDNIGKLAGTVHRARLGASL